MRWPPENHPAVDFPTLRRALYVLKVMMLGVIFFFGTPSANAGQKQPPTVASWYGEPHRGKLMANGKRFNPDRLTAASWFYALGTKVRVTSANKHRRSVVVTITDRGPAWELVKDGRAIDLSHAAFRQLASPETGLVEVKLEQIR